MDRSTLEAAKAFQKKIHGLHLYSVSRAIQKVLWHVEASSDKATQQREANDCRAVANYIYGNTPMTQALDNILSRMGL